MPWTGPVDNRKERQEWILDCGGQSKNHHARGAQSSPFKELSTAGPFHLLEALLTDLAALWPV